MMQRCATLLLSLLALTHPVPTSAHRLPAHWSPHSRSGQVAHHDVVVIGGGAAGTYAAVRLAQEGKSVALIEKNDRLGGQVNTYYDKTTGKPFDYGVQFFGNCSVSVDFFNYLGVETTGGEEPKSQAFVDFTTGTKVPSTVVANKTGDYKTALKGWIQHLYKYPWLTEQSGYHLPKTIPDELFMPFGEYLAKYNLGGLTTLLSYTAQQGNILGTPTFYYMKWLNVANSALGGFWQKDGNNQAVYNAAFDKLGGAKNVYLSSKVNAIHRDGRGVEVCLSTPSGEHTVMASQLVMAMPPKLENMGFLDVTPTERSLFGKFTNNYLYTAVVLNSGLKTGSVAINFDPSQQFGIPAAPLNPVLSAAAEIPNAALTQWASKEYTSPADAEAGMLASVAKVQKSLNLTSPAGTKPTLAAVANHSPYFFYVSEDAIKSGFYDKINALQGQMRTYWTGAAFEAQDTASIWNFTNTEIIPRVLRS